MKKEEELFQKWLDHNLTEAELKSLELSSDFTSFKKIDALAQQYRAPQFDASSSLAEILKQQPTATKSYSLVKYISGIAAAILIAFGLFQFLGNAEVTQYAHNGEQKNLSLPGTSKVVLNADSQIVFNEDTWKDNREVQLKGEGYFNVAKGATFNVNTDQGVVTVLGTQFKVKDRKNYFEVSCFEGLVAVQIDGKTFSLPAGTSLKMIEGKIDKNAISEIQPTWIDDISVFKSTSLSYVLNEFSRQYDIAFNVSEIDTTVLFTGSFTHKNMENALQSIAKPLSLTVDIKGNTVTFKK